MENFRRLSESEVFENNRYELSGNKSINWQTITIISVAAVCMVGIAVIISNSNSKKFKKSILQTMQIRHNNLVKEIEELKNGVSISNSNDGEPDGNLQESQS